MGREIGHHRAHDRFLPSHADSPHEDPGPRGRGPVEKHQGREAGRDQGGEYEAFDAHAVVHPSEEERGSGVDSHGRGVEQRDHGFGEHGPRLEVVRDQGKIRESERDASHGCHVEPVFLAQVLCPDIELFDLEIARIRVQNSSHADQSEGYERGREEHREPGPEVVVPEKQDRGDDEGTEDRADLVHGLVKAIGPAAAHLRACIGEHRVARGGPDRFAEPLGYDEHGGEHPVPRQGEERYRQEIDRVAEEGEKPVPFGLVREVSRHDPEGVADELAEPGHEPDQCGARAEHLQVGPDDAPGPFVGHVGEQAHAPEQDHEDDGRVSADFLCFF